MLKSNLLLASLVLGLAACNGGVAGQPAPAQVEVAQPVEVESGQPMTESMAETEKATAEEAVVKAEKPAMEDAITDEAMVKAEEPVAADTLEDEAMVKAEEPAAEVAMAEESMGKAKESAAADTTTEDKMTAPVEGEMMAQEKMAEAGPTEAQLQLLAGLKNQGMPPELFNPVWLNSDPLKLADLHGKVVIVEFWTFGCYNCKNVVPSLRAWHHTYSDEGLVIIGVHTPEFGYERELENVKQALIDQDIPYAVALDNDWQTWRAYNNRYWPAKYFVDKTGNLRHVAIGEGRYEEQEEIIKALLAEKV